MITVTKEKNLIHIADDESNKSFTLDINTGILYGANGKVVKSIPKVIYERVFDYYNTNCSIKNTVVCKLIGNITSGYCTHMKILPNHADLLRFADSLDNMGISGGFSRWGLQSDLEELLRDKKLMKEYLAYARECIATESNYDFTEFKRMAKVRKIDEMLGINISEERYNKVRPALENIITWATPRQIKCFIINFVENDLVRYSDIITTYRLSNEFKEYCNMCEFLHEKVTTKENFFSEYARVSRAYQAIKEKVDLEQFQKAMDMHREEMIFSYGDYEVVLPTCPQDIKDEGINMHHCVGGYAKRCIEFDNPNRSYIVFIRNKANLDKCYITCEIKNGKIGQYYLAYDRTITEKEDIAFRNAYAIHLRENWVRE